MQGIKKQHYLPIDDEMVLSWRILTEEEKARRLSEFKKNEVQGPDHTSQLTAIEADLFDLIQYLTHKDPEIARALHLLNRKINLLAKKEPQETAHSTLVEQKPQPVTLSTNGIIFMTTHSLLAGQEIQIEMVLAPEKTYIVCYGVVNSSMSIVVDAAKKPQMTSYRISVDFTAMREDDMTRVVEHILQKEDQNFQARRKQ